MKLSYDIEREPPFKIWREMYIYIYIYYIYICRCIFMDKYMYYMHIEISDGNKQILASVLKYLL